MILRILVGVGMLILGRQLFWLFVAAMGFVLAMDLVPPAFPGQPMWIVILIALGAGLLGAMIAIVWQWVAVGAAGFMAGGYVAINVLPAISVATDRFPWLLFLLGGIVGAVLLMALFDWALIALSSLFGATMIVQAIPLDPLISMLLFGGLVLAGIMIQASLWRSTLAKPLS